jgi:tellurite resistance protein
MEAILGFIAIVIVFAGVRFVLSAATRTVGAAAKAAVGKGSFSDNMELAFKGMGPLEARMVNQRLGDNDDGPLVKAIEVKGLFPVDTTRHIAFITSVFDKTDGEFKPVLSAIEMFQEAESIVYQQVSEIGAVSPDQGFISWVRVGGVIPEILEPPFGGKRTFVAVIRMVDIDDPPEIELGFHAPNGPSPLWVDSLEFNYYFEGKGYEESAESRDHARALSIQIGMAVAFADGTFDDSEGETLREFIVKAVSPFDEEKQKHLKEVYNTAMKEAYAAAKMGDLSLSKLTSELNELAETSSKYETIELCFDVMAADGVADAEEMRVIRKVAESLELDFDEIEKMRDKKIIGLDTKLESQSSVEELLGIEKDWDTPRIKQHLLSEFQKWNNRLNTLGEGEERANAQRMLDMIAEARRKYG